MSTRRTRLLAIANVATSQLCNALIIAGAFVVTPAIMHGVGDAAYGGWLLINSVVGYLRMLDQGTSTGTQKYGAGAIARGDDAELGRVLDTSAAMFLGAGLLAMTGTGIISLALPRWYGGIIGHDRGPILLLGAATAIDLALRVYSAGLRTRSLFMVVDGTEIITYSIFKLGLVLALRDRLSYDTLALIMLGECLTRNLIVVVGSAVLCPEVRRLHPLRLDRDMLRKFFLMGAALSIIMIADVVRFQVDATVIGWFRRDDPLAISTFGIGTRLPSIAYSAIGVIGAVLVPRFSGLQASGEKAGERALLAVSTRVIGLTTMFVLISIAVVGPQFLLLWLKKPWVAESGRIMLLMLPGYLIALISGPATGVLTAHGKLRGQTIITVVEAIANFTLSVALVRPLGLYGVALGTVVPMLVVRGIVFPLVLERELGITPREYFGMSARTFALGAIYFVVVVGLRWIPMTTFPRFLLMSAGCAVAFGLVLLLGLPGARGWVVAKIRRR